MKTRLALNIKKRTIQQAKILSAKTGKSISIIVEEYLNSIEKAPVNLNWKQVKAEYLKKKHVF